MRIASLLAGSVVEDDKEDEPKPGKLVRFDTSLASSESKDSDSVPVGSGNLEMDEDNGVGILKNGYLLHQNFRDPLHRPLLKPRKESAWEKKNSPSSF